MVQRRCRLALRALLAVEGDGEAVHLVLHLRHQAEQFAARLEPHRCRREAVEQFAGAVTAVLSQARDGDVQPQFVLHHAPYHLHLSHAAVRHDEVRQGVALVDGAAVAAAHHLAHRGVVVRADDRLYLILAVELFGRFKALKHHAGRHSIVALDVGVVEEFDAQRQPRQPQFALNLFHQAHRLLLRIQFLRLLQAVEAILLHVETR